MSVLAHSGGGWGWFIEPWEVHPALVHFPIAFLMAGVLVDVYAWWRGRPSLVQVASGLLIAGLLTGVIAAVAGVVAFFTVPGHTQEAHRLMYWHVAIQAFSLLMFAWPACERWWNWRGVPSLPSRLVACVGALFLLVGSGIGGYIVYHGGAGVRPDLLAPEVRQHGHGDAQDEHKSPGDKQGHQEQPFYPITFEEKTGPGVQHDHQQKSKNANKTEPVKKEQDHKGHDPAKSATPQDKQIGKSAPAVKKEQDPHKGHDQQKSAGTPDKQAGKMETAHKEHGQPLPPTLPAVPPASAAAAYVPEGYYVQVVLYNLSYPSSLEFDDKGNLYIAEDGEPQGSPKAMPRVVRVQLAGNVETVVSEGLDAPVTNLRWYEGRLYISHGGKTSAWTDKGGLVDLLPGMPTAVAPQGKQIMNTGPDGKLYLGQGHRLVRVDSKTSQVETFFGRQEDAKTDHDAAHKENAKSAAGMKHDDHGKGHDHKDHAKVKDQHQAHGKNHVQKDHAHAKDEHDAMHAKHRTETQGHPRVEDSATAGPRRLMDIRFSPRGEALYVVDFGATFMTPDGPRSVPGTGVVWRIISNDAPVSVLLP